MPNDCGVMHFRRARPDDARAIARTHTDGWRTAYAHLMPAEFLASLDVERRVTFWSEQIATLPEDDRPWVAEGDTEAGDASPTDVVAGFVHSGPSRDEDTRPDAGEIYLIYVRQDQASRGIGRQLLAHAERDLAAHGYEIGLLWVLEANAAARSFYERQGWLADGATKTRVFGTSELTELRYRKLLDKPRVSADD